MAGLYLEELSVMGKIDLRVQMHYWVITMSVLTMCRKWFLSIPSTLSHIHTMLQTDTINPFNRQGHWSSGQWVNLPRGSGRVRNQAQVCWPAKWVTSSMPGTEVKSIHFGRPGQSVIHIASGSRILTTGNFWSSNTFTSLSFSLFLPFSYGKTFFGLSFSQLKVNWPHVAQWKGGPTTKGCKSTSLVGCPCSA